MDALAGILPDDWNFALFLHVLGAMVMVGALVLALCYLGAAWRGDSAGSLRLGFRVLLYGAVPSFLVMRLAGQWIYSKEGLDDLPTDPAWIDIGFTVGDIGLLFLIVATVVAGVGARRAAATEGAATAGVGSVRIAAVCTGLLLAAYIVAIWAMTTKPF